MYLRALPMLSVLALTAIVLSSTGDGLPSPAKTQNYFYDFDLDKHLPHHRQRRRTGRGTALDTWACDTVTGVPVDIQTDFPLDAFYEKYTHAYGVPIISSSTAQDAALTRACYTVRFLLADREDIRNAMYDQYGRVGVIAASERTTQIPEHSHLDSFWDDRARGLGGIPSIPITTDGEENILCKSVNDDRWFEEDVLIHEFAHAIHLISLSRIDSTFDDELQNVYDMAKTDNIWRATYAITNTVEYFAEGVQSFFSVQTCRSYVDNVHNRICTREILKNDDPRLYNLIVTVFPCMNTVVDRCETDQTQAANQVLKMDCELPTSTVPATTPSPTAAAITGSATAADRATTVADRTTTAADRTTADVTTRATSGSTSTSAERHQTLVAFLLMSLLLMP